MKDEIREILQQRLEGELNNLGWSENGLVGLEGEVARLNAEVAESKRLIAALQDALK